MKILKFIPKSTSRTFLRYLWSSQEWEEKLSCLPLSYGGNSTSNTKAFTLLPLYSSVFVHERVNQRREKKNEVFSYFFHHIANFIYPKARSEYRNMQEEGSVLVVILHAPWNFFHTLQLYVSTPHTQLDCIRYIFAFTQKLYIRAMSDVGSNNKKGILLCVMHNIHF